MGKPTLPSVLPDAKAKDHFFIVVDDKNLRQLSGGLNQKDFAYCIVQSLDPDATSFKLPPREVSNQPPLPQGEGRGEGSRFTVKSTKQEVMDLRSQIATSSGIPRTHGGRCYQPRVFTEHGALSWPPPC